MKRLLKQIRSIRIFKTLRFRLASTFLLLLTVVTIGVGIAGTQLLKSILTSRTEDTLMEEFTALRGYLHFYDTNGEPYWQVDQTDPEEQSEFEGLTSVYVVARSDGTMWRGTTDRAFSDMTSKNVILQELAQLRVTRRQIFKQIQGDDSGPYEIVSGILTDTAHRKDWYVAVGRSLADNNQLLRRFRRNYFLVFVPVTIFLCILASWFSAGRALAALESVGSVAGDITGSNLGMQIPLRGANDELDRLIASFNEMSRRLKASFDQIRQFSTDVSHELRTPLTAIQGQLEVALFTAKQPEQLREAIENALQDVERLSNLVRALLLLSHSETGQLPMNIATVNLSEMLSELVEQFQIPAEAHNLQLSVTSSPPVYCQVDRIQMERVITNLLSNAIKYTPPGGWIRAWTETAGNAAKIVVEDTGIGIPTDHLPYIFDRFYRVPDPNPEKGLGLGLSFVASIVKAHGGQITVESEPGKGSRFIIQLVAARPPQPLLVGSRLSELH
jgi:heavy metal sensor kinase